MNSRLQKPSWVDTTDIEVRSIIFAVHPHYQRNGVATALIQQLEKRLTALGCPQIQLLIHKEDIDVSNFYEQLGYDEKRFYLLSKTTYPRLSTFGVTF